MIFQEINILLADDDEDDCLFFKEALESLPQSTSCTVVHDGQQLMQLLTKQEGRLFHIIFLDLNMPRKNGFSCLEEIKSNDILKNIPVVIFSTSLDESIADLLYKNGAHYYICKPTDFSHLKKLIQGVLTLTLNTNPSQPPRQKFVISNVKSILT